MYSRYQTFVSIAAFSFLSGAPFGLLNDALPVYLKTQGLSLTEIGLWQIVNLPITFKLLLGPIVDRFPEPTRWLRGTCLALSLGTCCFALIHSQHLLWLICIAIAMATASGLADVVIDGTYLRQTPDHLLPIGNGIRITAYRLGKITSDSGLLLLATSVTWPHALILLAACYGIVTLFMALRSWRVQEAVTSLHAPTFEQMWVANRDWFQQPAILHILLFLLLFRLPDFIMTPMVAPFWLDRGASISSLALVNNMGGMLLIIAGFYVTAWWLQHTSLEKIFIVVWGCQILPNLGYGMVAGLPNHPNALPYLYALSILENFTQGLGQGTLLAVMTKFCQKSQAATQFALLSAILNIPRITAGMMSGYLAQQSGYAVFFYLTALAGVPGLIALLGLRRTMAESPPQHLAEQPF